MPATVTTDKDELAEPAATAASPSEQSQDAEKTKLPEDNKTRPLKSAQAAKRSRKTLIWPAILLLLLLFVVGQKISQSLHVPSEQDLQQAGKYIQQHYQTNDAVAVSPPWALRSLQYLGSIKATFDPQLAEHPPEAERLWVLAEAEGQEQIDQLGKTHKQIEAKKFGRIEVALFNMGEQRSFHAVDHIADAQVQIQAKAGPVACDQWKNDRWTCQGRPEWQHIGVEALDVDLAPRPIIWAHPAPAGEQLQIAFDNVPLAQSLDIMAGNTVHGAQFGKAPIVIDLYIDDRKVGSHSFTGYPLQHWRVDSHELAGQKHHVKLSLHTSDNGANHFAFDFVVVSQ